MVILPLSYYQEQDALQVSKNLLGKFLLTNFNGMLTGGMIVETEAYCAPDDKASHASGNRRTKRNEVMYHKGGVSYVYLCYGIHSLFNVVVHREDIPHAVLIRALEPTIGLDIMLQRRCKTKLDRTITSGPGVLTQALGINLLHNGLSLVDTAIWIEDRGVKLPENEVVASPRVGVDYAAEDARLPWRFRIVGNPWTSKPF